MVRRIVPDILACLGLAAASGWLLVQGSQPAFWTSNVSLTWLLLPLWFGWRLARPVPGAVMGLVMTWSCLLAYYLPPILLAHGGNPDLLTRFGVRYLALGTLSGPVLGLVGAWWRAHPTVLVPAGVALLAVAERWAWRWRVGYDAAPGVFTVEACLGLALAAAMALWVRRERAARTVAVTGRK